MVLGKLKETIEKVIQIPHIKKVIKQSFLYGWLNPLRDRFDTALDSLSKYKIKKILDNKEDPLIIEIGASNGADSVAFLQIFKKATLYCFEPSPLALEAFKNRMSLLKKSKLWNYSLVPLALSNENSQMNLYLMDEDPKFMQATLKELKNARNMITYSGHEKRVSKSIKIKTKRLDDWVKERGIEKIELIWADVEGAEENLIEGGADTLINKTRFFYTEYSNIELFKGQISLKEILKMLPGFKVRWISENNVLLENVNLNKKLI